MKRHLNPYFFNFILLCIILFSGVTQASAEPYQTIINNGSPQNRVDIAILGDGYTAAELPQYQADVQQFMQGVFAQETYFEYQRYYNVHRVDVISNESGADHPERTPQVFVDTAFDATYNCSNIPRLICVNTTKVNQVIAASLPANHFDVILVLVNDAEYGGSGGSVAVASKNASAVELILHEVGHSFGLLADEYSGSGPLCNPNVEPSEPNATRQTQRASIKWNAWINAATPIPTTTMTNGIPGLYEGSRYCDTGLYRPTTNNKMRTLGVPFEQINNEQQTKRIYNFVSPIDSSSPIGTTVDMTTSQSQTFSVATPLPFTHNLNINWTVDGQAAATGGTFQLSGSTLSVGQHTIQVLVSDPTPFVRNDPGQVLTQTRTWIVNVQEVTSRPTFDFDGDGRSDISVFRPDPGNDNNNYWTVLQSSNNQITYFEWGIAADADSLAPADYDGDGKTDFAIYRKSENNFYIYNSSDNSVRVENFGIAGDKLTVADWDNDDKADISVYRKGSQSTFYFRGSNNNPNGNITYIPWGTVGDKTVNGDFDGDGLQDAAVFRPSNSVWYIYQSSNGRGKPKLDRSNLS